MTEQQLRERAEAILRKHYKVFGKTDTAWKAFKESTTYKYAIDAMIDFHKQELQRIGEVYVSVSVEEELPNVKFKRYVIASRDGNEYDSYLFNPEERSWSYDWQDTQIPDIPIKYWLKKLSLLEVKDFTDR